jgi:pyruvate formate lyase activating enzyme
MHIGGLLKYSLIDFAPHVSCVIFTAGCNFRCPYCHNPELTSQPKNNSFDVQGIMDFLASRQKHLDGVVISGGEPSLQKDLPDFCQALKKMGFLVKLDTNGSNPQVIENLLGNGFVDYIAMDIKTIPEYYSQWISPTADASAIRNSVKTILESGLDHEFRTTCARPLTDESFIRSMAKLISGARLHAFQHLKKESVLDPHFFSKENRFYSDEEIVKFKDIMAQYVEKAIIR